MTGAPGLTMQFVPVSFLISMRFTYVTVANSPSYVTVPFSYRFWVQAGCQVFLLFQIRYNSRLCTFGLQAPPCGDWFFIFNIYYVLMCCPPEHKAELFYTYLIPRDQYAAIDSNGYVK